MSTNPYQPPAAEDGRFSDERNNQRSVAQGAVAGPAVALMVVAGLCIVLCFITIPFNVFLIASGLAERFDRGGADPFFVLYVRMTWSCVLLAVSCYVFWGALQMKRLANFGHARAASIVAAIPCVGPCCLLGIPYGIWALMVLSREEIQSAFEN